MSRPFSETYIGRLRAQVGTRLLQVPAFRAIIEDPEGKVLLQLRADYRKWGLPGGHPEERKSLLDCVKREVLEETGLSLNKFRCFGYSTDPSYEITAYPNGDMIHTFALLVHATEWDGNLDKSNDESLELRFFHLQRLPEMLPNEKRCIDLFLTSKKTNEFVIT